RVGTPWSLAWGQSPGGSTRVKERHPAVRGVRILEGVCAASVALAAFPAGAPAGEYHVYSCRTPSGESAPADGWSGSVAPGGAFDDYAINTCHEGGALIAALGDATVHAADIDRSTWAFGVPTTARATSATLWRAGYLHGQAGEHATYQFWLAGPNETSIFDECIYTVGCSQQGFPGQPLSVANR